MFKANRRKLLKSIKNNSIVILYSATKQTRNNDVFHNYRQESNFYYLTGCDEPNCKLILLKDAVGKTKELFFKHKQSPKEKIWNDHSLSFEQEKKRGGWSTIHDLSGFEKYLDKIKKFPDTLYIDYKNIEIFLDLVKRKSSIKEIVDVTFNIGHQRLVKSPFELKKIKTAIEVTNIAVLNVLQRLSDFTHENHIEATVLEVFKRNNVETAYPTIVAGGNNGVILHYTKNNQVLGEGEMVLMDVGCEFECYASDITRTFPKSKYFSPIQKEVYQGVLDVQKKILAEVRVGQTFIKLNEIYRTLMVELLLDLKILKDTVEENLKNEHYKRYVPHSVGHWLGLDVHDATPYFEAEKPISFKPGMVLTIEPGVYLNKDDISVPEKFKGIAIRIEDNILVTSDGCEVLSKSIPKEIDEIEQLLN